MDSGTLMTKGYLFGLGIAVAALTACGQAGESGADAEIASLEQQVQSLRVEIDLLQDGVNELRSDLSLDKINRRVAREAWVPITGAGYALLQTTHGPLAMSITDVKPYANGSRLTLQIGNLSPAAFTEVKFTVSYGPNAEGAEFLDMEKAKTMEWQVSNSIPGARWSLHTLTLDGVKPDDLDHLWVTQGEVTRIAF